MATIDVIARRAPAALAAAILSAGFDPAEAAIRLPRTAERLFVSGHSLTDRPLPDYLAAIAAAEGAPLQWNQQTIDGSTIRSRTSIDAGQGYRRGRNRDGHGLDVRAELRAPRTVTGGAYDTLIVAEQHSLLGGIMWNDTTRSLRDVHEQLIAGNPRATTFLFGAWLDIADRDDPRRWIAYEKDAAIAWQCVAARINRSLAAEGRRDRIEPLLAGEALALLVEAATTGAGVPGLTAATPRLTLGRLFRDDVHLTPAGTYFIALVAYDSLFRRSPLAGWAPAEVPPAMARALRQAARAITARQRRDPPRDLQACRDHVAGPFLDTYLAYQRDTAWRGAGVVRAYAKWLRHRVEWRWRLTAANAGNPLYFDPARDRDYWLPAR